MQPLCFNNILKICNLHVVHVVYVVCNVASTIHKFWVYARKYLWCATTMHPLWTIKCVCINLLMHQLVCATTCVCINLCVHQLVCASTCVCISLPTNCRILVLGEELPATPSVVKASERSSQHLHYLLAPSLPHPHLSHSHHLHPNPHPRPHIPHQLRSSQYLAGYQQIEAKKKVRFPGKCGRHLSSHKHVS